MRSDEAEGMGSKALATSILPDLWLTMTEYGYLANPTTEDEGEVL